MYLHFPNNVRHDNFKNEAYLRVLLFLADSIKLMLGTCQKEVNDYIGSHVTVFALREHGMFEGVR